MYVPILNTCIKGWSVHYSYAINSLCMLDLLTFIQAFIQYLIHCIMHTG